MFVWECIRSEGTHLGMCMDGFMFGSCCGHNLTDNFILPPSTPFTVKPTQPTRVKPSKKPPKPSSSSNSGTMTIHRPNGSGTLVIRQPQKPQKTKTTPATTTTRKPRPTKTTTRNPIDNFNDQSFNELMGASSVSTREYLNVKKSLKFQAISSLSDLVTWSSTSSWQVTTEPNFVTKPRPSPWDKSTSVRPKPKPTKKPISYGSTETATKRPVTFKPKQPVSPSSLLCVNNGIYLSIFHLKFIFPRLSLQSLRQPTIILHPQLHRVIHRVRLRQRQF